MFNETLKYGSTGEDVKWLQQKLLNYGYSTCLVKEQPRILTVDGKFGLITEGCLSSFQAKVIDAISEDFIKQNIPEQYNREYIVTGEMDYPTWYVLENFEKLTKWYEVEITPPEIKKPEKKKPEPEKRNIIEEVIFLARKEIGVVEVGGNNYGKRVQEYQRIGSNGAMTGGAAWCQYFQNWLQITACINLKIKYKGTHSGYTPTVTNWGIKNGIGIKHPKMSQIDIGDLGYVYSSARNNSQHVYLIVGKSGNSVITIEGNTNPGGSSSGFGVFQRKRSLGNQCWVVVKWHKLYK